MDEIITYVGIGLAGLGVLWWAYKRYKVIMADGKITLDEVLETVEEAIDIVNNAVNNAKTYNDIESLKKVDLVELCRENGFKVSGNKADLLERLEDIYEKV